MNPVDWATTTRFGWLNARKKHNLPYIETIHIQAGRRTTFYHRGVENAQVISQKKDAKPILARGAHINIDSFQNASLNLY